MQQQPFCERITAAGGKVGCLLPPDKCRAAEFEVSGDGAICFLLEEVNMLSFSQVSQCRIEGDEVDELFSEDTEGSIQMGSEVFQVIQLTHQF